MNIQHYMAHAQALEWALDAYSVGEIVSRRMSTFNGFADIERVRGLMPAKVDLNNSRGQDILRLMLFRTLEEVVESHLSHDMDHVLEEMVDAFNYLISIFFLDPLAFSPAEVEQFLVTQAEAVFIDQKMVARPSPSHLGRLTISLTGQLGDLLRNRAWMTNAQDVYFVGGPVLKEAIADALQVIWMPFADWQQFMNYYVAKDEVLRFRLRTNY